MRHPRLISLTVAASVALLATTALAAPPPTESARFNGTRLIATWEWPSDVGTEYLMIEGYDGSFAFDDGSVATEPRKAGGGRDKPGKGGGQAVEDDLVAVSWSRFTECGADGTSRIEHLFGSAFTGPGEQILGVDLGAGTAFIDAAMPLAGERFVHDCVTGATSGYEPITGSFSMTGDFLLEICRKGRCGAVCEFGGDLTLVTQGVDRTDAFDGSAIQEGMVDPWRDLVYWYVTG